MNTADLRSAYLAFFESRGHRIVPSSSLVPNNDPTLLFTNSGMVQFKDPLLGKENPGYNRATSAQRCVRAGGKHNDLENVGFTARHHTFFEMMGNFSFGDYFKEETIAWAWEFITEVLKLPVEKLWVTVHPTDDESRAIWRDTIGVAEDRIIDIEENFWTMGDTGPCGPNTEIFYDHGPDVFGGPPGSPDEDGDRYVEFWNLVFPQYDLAADGTLSDLPQSGVDTGLGLERTAAILQGVTSCYEIDIFRGLMLEAARYAGINDQHEALHNPSVRVIADHMRSSAFLIADGVEPGRDGRAYVLRRIVRRALRHGHKLGIKGPFFSKLVKALVEDMGEAYPIIAEKSETVEAVLAAEEAQFGETLSQGMELLQDELHNVRDKTLPGDVAFKLYDTYGFPVDLTADVLREQGIEVDMTGFEEMMEAQRERGRSATSFEASLAQKVAVQGAVDFLGYEGLEGAGKVVALFSGEGDPVDRLSEAENGIVVLDQTPFYAESGGQVGDVGRLASSEVTFEVNDTQSSGDQNIHIGRVTSGSIELGTELSAAVDAGKREMIRRNHSATHLMHAALRKVLGTHVEQKGSLVNDEKLRFDFSHDQPVTRDEIFEIEDIVNEQIRLNSTVETELMHPDDAKSKGAMALFDEVYGDEARVLTMGGGYSVELCGGTHVSRTGDIGFFKILSESGIAAGVRRIEAVSGVGASVEARQSDALIEDIAQSVKSNRLNVEGRVIQLVEENRRFAKEVEMLNQKLASSQSVDLGDQVIDVAGIPFVGALIEGDAKAMMQMLDTLKSKHPAGVIVLAQESKGKVAMVVGVGKDSSQQVGADRLLAEIGPIVGVRGGGSPTLARGGGGSDIGSLPQALDRAQSWIAEQLQ